MPTYTYKCDVHDVFEVEHSIKEVLENCPKCEEEGLEFHKVVRLITGGLGFILTGGGWAKDNYS